ncbi:MAG TPA: beta-galactosidase, partial [Dysgonomonas sp.]|nr:beta-galactosidase [Dysgonomonas sp.]
SSADAKMDGNLAVLSVVYELAAGNDYIVNYKVYPSGIVNASVKFTSTAAEEAAAELTAEAKEATQSDSGQRDRRRQESSKLEVPRIGVRFRMPVQMNQVQYLGRGPEDNYEDRKMGTLIGYYKTTAEEMYYPYVRPQENGHHSDTRWVALNSSSGKGLLIEADKTIGFNSLRNSIEDFDCQESDEDYQWRNMSPQEIANKDYEAAKNVLRKQTHEADIVPRDFIEVCVDMKQSGVAGYNSWGARPEPGYTIPANQEYNWGFTLIPISNASEAPKKIGYKY